MWTVTKIPTYDLKHTLCKPIWWCFSRLDVEALQFSGSNVRDNLILISGLISHSKVPDGTTVSIPYDMKNEFKGAWCIGIRKWANFTK